jgi:hypothetical protein
MASIKTVVQQTNKTTVVTANYKNCIIQTVPLTDAAGTFFSFNVINKQFYPEQNIQVTPVYSGTGIPYVTLVGQTKWSFILQVANLGSAAFNGPLIGIINVISVTKNDVNEKSITRC